MEKDKNEETPVHLRIKKVREAVGLSQRDFSALLSLSSSYCGGVESGTLKVNRRFIRSIACEFNINEDWLLNGVGEMFAENSDEKFSKLLGVFKELPAKYQHVVFKLIEVLRKLDDSPSDTDGGSQTEQ
jgi:transcriptional regulator with XRE-family HTH domain